MFNNCSSNSSFQRCGAPLEANGQTLSGQTLSDWELQPQLLMTHWVATRAQVHAEWAVKSAWRAGDLAPGRNTGQEGQCTWFNLQCTTTSSLWLSNNDEFQSSARSLGGILGRISTVVHLHAKQNLKSGRKSKPFTVSRGQNMKLSEISEIHHSDSHLLSDISYQCNPSLLMEKCDFLSFIAKFFEGHIKKTSPSHRNTEGTGPTPQKDPKILSLLLVWGVMLACPQHFCARRTLWQLQYCSCKLGKQQIWLLSRLVLRKRWHFSAKIH